MNLNIHCPHCHNALEVDPAWAGHQLDCPVCSQPFTVPAAPVVRTAPAPQAYSAPAAPPPLPRLWNPNSAASWSVLFGPAFGPYLHHLNWRALGDHGRAAGAFRWFVAGLLVTLALTFAVTFSPDLASAAFMISLFFMAIWLFVSGKKQVAYIKQHFGENYERRSWWQPVLGGFAAILLLGFVVELIGGGVQEEILTRQSVTIINNILDRSNIKPDVRCLRVQLEGQAGPDTYFATAFFSTGDTAPARVQLQGDVVQVNIEPGVILALQTYQAMNSMLTPGDSGQTTSSSVPQTQQASPTVPPATQSAPAAPPARMPLEAELIDAPSIDLEMTLGQWYVKVESAVGLEQLRALQNGDVTFMDGLGFMRKVGKPALISTSDAGTLFWVWSFKDGNVAITVAREAWEEHGAIGVIEFSSKRE